MQKTLELLPAVDLVDGTVVMLHQGVAGSEKVYGDPVQAALSWQQAGAQWLHLVDLDAAFGRGNNREVVREIVSSLDINVELSGGLRDEQALEEAFTMGATRINMGTAALENPEWTAAMIDRYGQKIAISLDVRGDQLAGRGWVSEGGNLWEVLQRLEDAGCPRYVVTDVLQDGTLSGPNLKLLADICARTQAPVVASGGISSLADLQALAGMVPEGVEGAIIGSALYENKFTLPQALEVVARN